MNNTELELLKIIADMEGAPDGAYNIRANSELASRHVTENVDIVTKTDKPGIDIIIKPGTKGEKVGRCCPPHNQPFCTHAHQDPRKYRRCGCQAYQLHGNAQHQAR